MRSADTLATATLSASAELIVNRREILTPPGPVLQNVASKYVAATAPVPAPSGHTAGSSAPLSVEVTSMR